MYICNFIQICVPTIRIKTNGFSLCFRNHVEQEAEKIRGGLTLQPAICSLFSVSMTQIYNTFFSLFRFNFLFAKSILNTYIKYRHTAKVLKEKKETVLH